MQKLQITNTASIPTIVTLFISIHVPHNFLQRKNTKTSSADGKELTFHNFNTDNNNNNDNDDNHNNNSNNNTNTINNNNK